MDLILVLAAAAVALAILGLGVWGIMRFFVRRTGWGRLVELYPASHIPKQLYGFCFGQINGFGHGRSLNVGMDPDGLYVEWVWGFAKPVFIPWTYVNTFREETFSPGRASIQVLVNDLEMLLHVPREAEEHVPASVVRAN